MDKKEKNPFVSDKPLYDYSIEYDISNLPTYLKDIIQELEAYDLVDDWVSYDCKFDLLDVKAKEYWRNNKITEQDYKTIIKKYGGIYDWN